MMKSLPKLDPVYKNKKLINRFVPVLVNVDILIFLSHDFFSRFLLVGRGANVTPLMLVFPRRTMIKSTPAEHMLHYVLTEGNVLSNILCLLGWRLQIAQLLELQVA